MGLDSGSSDNAQSETTFVTRNRQLSTFSDVALGAKVAYSWKKLAERYDVKFHAAYEYVHYSYKDFTDIRTGSPYAHGASVLQLFVSALF